MVVLLACTCNGLDAHSHVPPQVTVRLASGRIITVPEDILDLNPEMGHEIVERHSERIEMWVDWKAERDRALSLVRKLRLHLNELCEANYEHRYEGREYPCAGCFDAVYEADALLGRDPEQPSPNASYRDASEVEP